MEAGFWVSEVLPEGNSSYERILPYSRELSPQPQLVSSDWSIYRILCSDWLIVAGEISVVTVLQQGAGHSCAGSTEAKERFHSCQ